MTNRVNPILSSQLTISHFIFLFLTRQILYYKVSGRVLPLNTQTKALLIAILLPALSSLSVIITHLTMVDFKIFQVSALLSIFSHRVLLFLDKSHNLK